MNVFDLQAILRLDSSEYDTKLKLAEGSANGLGGKLTSGFSKIGKAAKVGFLAAGAAASAFGVSAIKTSMTFDASMSQVAATMGYTVSELNTAGSEAQQTYQKLSAFAQEMGSTTKFTATESAEALNYMALAGYDAETSIQMLPNVLNLAAAGNMELAAASDMVTDSQTALGLTVEQTSDLVDQMAKASSKSNTSIEQLGDAILTVGGTAKNLTGGTVELTAALGVLANAGIKGSEGGTALRNVLLAMTPKSKDAAAAMKQIGMEAYTADGELRPLNDTFGDMAEQLNAMSTQDRQEVLSKIFNKVDLKSVNAMLAASSDGVDKVSYALQSAAVDWESYSSQPWASGENAFQELSQTVLDGLTTMGMSTEDTAKLISEKYGISMEDARAAVETVNTTIEDGANSWEQLESAIADSKGAAEEMAQVQLDNLQGKVTLLKSAFEGFQLIVSGKVTPTLTKFVSGLGNMFTEINQRLNNGGGLQSVFFIVTRYATEAAQSVISAMNNMASGIAESAPRLITSFMRNLTTLSTKARSLASGFVDAGINIATSLAQGIANGLPTIIQRLPTIISNFAGIINDNAPKLLAAGVNIIVTLAKGIVAAIPTLVANIPKILKSIWDVWMAFSWTSLGSKLISGIKGGIGSAGKNLPNTIKSIFTKAKDFITNVKFSGVGKTVMESLLLGMRNIVQKFGPWLKNELSTGIDAVKAVDWLGVGTAIITTIGNGLVSAGSFIMDALGSAIGSAAEALDAVDWGAVGETIKNGFMSAVEFLFVTIPEKLGEIGSSIMEVFGQVDWMALGSTVMTYIVNGITAFGSFLMSALGAVATMAATAFTSINWAGVGSTVISFLGSAISGMGGFVISALSAIGSAAIGAFRAIPWSSVGSAVINFIASGIRGLGSLISSALRAIGTAAMNAFKSINWGSLGRAVIQGIANGIRNGASLIADAAKSAAKNAFDKAKEFLGISSPSKLFRDEVGKRISEGIGVGIEQNMPVKQTQRALNNLLSSISGTAEVSLNTVGRTMKAIIDDVSDFEFEPPIDEEYTTEIIGNVSSGEEESPEQPIDITINVYATEHQDERAIADMVAERLAEVYRHRRMSYA